jgi:pimeloyl-ACP methyl ester carboxylesterase
MSDKPVLLFVTGAWHPPKCYDGLKSSLINLGYDCVVPKLPSVGPESHGVTWKADTAKILETAEQFFVQGREVVLIAHSYGGIPATAATQGQGVQERKIAGLKGGFHSIIFLAAFAIPVRGWDLITTFGGAYPPWLETSEKYTKVLCGHKSRFNETRLTVCRINSHGWCPSKLEIACTAAAPKKQQTQSCKKRSRILKMRSRRV